MSVEQLTCPGAVMRGHMSPDRGIRRRHAGPSCTSLWTGRDDSAISVATVAVAKDVPEHPPDHPVLLLNSVCVSAQIVYDPRFRPRHAVYSKNLAVRYGLADLGIAVWWLDGGVPERWNQHVLALGHSSSALHSLFLGKGKIACSRRSCA